MNQSSEFCRHKHFCCFSTSVYYCKLMFRYRLSPESFGYTLLSSLLLCEVNKDARADPWRHSCCGLLGCDAVQCCGRIAACRKIMLPSSSGCGPPKALVSYITTGYHNPENRDINLHRRENRLSNVKFTQRIKPVILSRTGIFLFAPAYGPALRSNGYRRLFPPGVKRPSREADLSPPSNAENKNAWICTSAPQYIMHN
jgi:hypothetical protein